MGAKTERKMVRTNHTNGIIDTDILIDATNGIADAVAFLVEQQATEVQISIVSAMELIAGCRNKEEIKWQSAVGSH